MAGLDTAVELQWVSIQYNALGNDTVMRSLEGRYVIRTDLYQAAPLPEVVLFVITDMQTGMRYHASTVLLAQEWAKFRIEDELQILQYNANEQTAPGRRSVW